jgi:hypothetical protein
MTQYALIQDDVIREIFDNMPVFHADLMAQIETVADDVTPGMVRQDDGVFAIPSEPIESIKTSLAAHRYQRESEGVLYHGNRFWTARETRSTWQRIIDAARGDGAYVYPSYKAMNGWVTDIPASDIIAIDALGIAHITRAFEVERIVDTEIDVGTITDSGAAIARFDEVFDGS